MIHSPRLAAIRPAGPGAAWSASPRRPGGRPCRERRAKGLPAGVAGVGEVEVLDRQRTAAVDRGEPQQLGDRLPQPAIPGWGWLPIEVERDRVGSPSGLPVGLRTQAARWSALRSTPRLLCSRSSSNDGVFLAGSRQEASRYQRPLPLVGSRLTSYLTAPPLTCAAHSAARWVNTTGPDSR